MRTSSLLLVTVFIILCTSNVQSKRRRCSDKKPKPTHNPKPCQRLTHCVTDQWSVWSNCSVACGTNGTQTRTRKVRLIVRNLNCMNIRVQLFTENADVGIGQNEANATNTEYDSSADITMAARVLRSANLCKVRDWN